MDLGLAEALSIPFAQTCFHFQCNVPRMGLELKYWDWLRPHTAATVVSDEGELNITTGKEKEEQ